MPKLDDLRDEYAFLDADDRYRLLIDLGRTLEPMPDALKTDATLVRGCSAAVWVYPTPAGDTLHFLADSNAAITKGIIALVLLTVQDRPAPEIAAADIEASLAPFDLKSQLSSNRTQGIPNMIALIRDTAQRYAGSGMRLARRTVAALALALLLAGSVAIAKPAPAPKRYPTGAFAIAGIALAATDVFDARALPDLQGKPSLMITLSPVAAARIVSGANGRTRLPCTLDGTPLGDSPADALASDHVLQLSGAFGDYDAAAAIARRISGRDPLPDAEADE